MSELEPIEPPPVCPICKKPKERLRRLTEKKHEIIWVCTTETKKVKMPCDGWAYKVAASHD